MKQVPIEGNFTEGERVIVFSPNHLYINKTGYVERLGSAGEDVIYYHVKLDGIHTPITFIHSQIRKE